MSILDIIVFILYVTAMLGVGFFFMRRNKGSDDYYVGGRNMNSLHVGLSVVATDVGGGFSIGLGGLGFAIGMSGSWMLFTGLLGAWLSAVVLIPRVKDTKAFQHFQTFPEIFGYLFDKKVALLAGIISAIGYIGFTSSQLLAGAKLASETFDDLGLQSALLFMGVIAIVYTVMGGLKAVIYTDTVQWIILMSGLIFIGIPLSYSAVGGWEGITSTVGPEFLSFTNVSWQELANWGITIIPIWFVGMTLYQRIYACRDKETAKRAWFYAGLFEWPIMALMGVSLGLLARVGVDSGLLGAMDAGTMDPELGLPRLLSTVLPVGLMGLMMSAYFSAILSTADSCLMASSGNVVSDIIGHFKKLDRDSTGFLRLSQLLTLGLGVLALLIALAMTRVLDLMLLSYAFMVSGLLVPIVGGLIFRARNSLAAFLSMILGGSTTLFLQLHKVSIPGTFVSFFGDKDVSAYPRERVAEWYGILQERFPALLKKSPIGLDKQAMAEQADQQLIWVRSLDIAFQLPWQLDPNIFGIGASFFIFMLTLWTTGRVGP